MDRSLVEGFISIFGARVARTIIAIITLPLIVRALGPGGYGDYGFLISTISVVLIFVSSGVTEGAQKFAAESRGPEWRQAIVGYYFRLATVLAVIGAVLLALVTSTGIFGRVFDERFTLYFYLLAVYILTAQYQALSHRLLLAFGLERYSEPLNVAYKLIWVAVGLSLVVAGYGVAGMLVGHLIGMLIVAVVGFRIVFDRVPLGSIRRPIPDEFPTRQLRSFNSFNIVLVLLTTSLYHVDILMLRTLIGSEQTGYYRAALSLAEYLWLVPISLQALLLHSTSALWSEQAYDRINDLSARITRYTILFTGLLAIGIAALADPFVPLYFGEDFAPAILPILWLLPGTIGFAAARPIMAMSQAHGDLKPLVIATGAAALINLVLNAALIPPYGMVGAAVATSIGYGSMFAFHAVTARYIGYDPLSDLRVGRIAATTAVTAVVVFLLATLIQAPVVALVVVPATGAAVHLGSALLVGAVDASEVRDLLSWIPGPFPSSH